MLRFLTAAVLLTISMIATPVLAQSPSSEMLVLGVIAAGDTTTSVALLKTQNDGRTFAVRVGQEVAKNTFIRRVTRDYVYFERDGVTEKIRVGESIGDGAFGAQPISMDEGINRVGNTVRVTAALRDQVMQHELSKVLMQAAAVPYYEAGVLRGFRLLEIDPGSLYEKTGFQNGDLITAINGNQLTDVSLTIRMLQALKNETHVDVTLVRSGFEHTLSISID